MSIARTCPECDAPATHDTERDVVTCTGCGWIRTTARFTERWIEREQSNRRGRKFQVRT